jgi:hypothetical protein
MFLERDPIKRGFYKKNLPGGEFVFHRRISGESQGVKYKRRCFYSKKPIEYFIKYFL